MLTCGLLQGSTGTDIEGLWLWNTTPVRNTTSTKSRRQSWRGPWRGEKVGLLLYVHKTPVLQPLETTLKLGAPLRMKTMQNHSHDQLNLLQFLLLEPTQRLRLDLQLRAIQNHCLRRRSPKSTGRTMRHPLLLHLLHPSDRPQHSLVSQSTNPRR